MKNMLHHKVIASLDFSCPTKLRSKMLALDPYMNSIKNTKQQTNYFFYRKQAKKVPKKSTFLCIAAVGKLLFSNPSPFSILAYTKSF